MMGLGAEHWASSEQGPVLASGPEGDVLFIHSEVHVGDLALCSLHPARSPSQHRCFWLASLPRELLSGGRGK